MNPRAGILARLGKGEPRSAEPRKFVRFEQVDDAQREKGVAVVAVLVDRRVVHGEDVHRFGIPCPHGQRIRIEQKAIPPLVIGQRGVTPLDRIGHLVERECQLTDFIARPHGGAVTAHARSQRVRIVDERFDRTHDERPGRVGEAQRQRQ